MNCYCGASKLFSSCCEPYILGNKNPETCLQLMQSRYAAYCICNAKYLQETTHISERGNYSISQILDWARSNSWQKLEIISFSENTVEFKAYYLDGNLKAQMHHEKSTFKKVDGNWFYVDGAFL